MDMPLIQIALAGFLFAVLVNNLLRLRRPSETPGSEPTMTGRVSTTAALGLVGLPAGLVGGLLGVGGGIIAVPAQQLCLRLPLRSAIANSAATILFSSVVGAAAKNAALSSHGHAVAESVRLALVLAPSAMFGSWIAAARVHRWPIRAIRLAFVLVLGFCCLKLARIGVSQIRHAAASASSSVPPSLGGSSIPVRWAAHPSTSTVDNCRLLVNRLRKQDVVLFVNVPMQVRLEFA